LPSTGGCNAGRAVRCELFCGRAIPPRDSVVQPFRCRKSAHLGDMQTSRCSSGRDPCRH
jgi:hypothetical protein